MELAACFVISITPHGGVGGFFPAGTHVFRAGWVSGMCRCLQTGVSLGVHQGKVLGLSP